MNFNVRSEAHVSLGHGFHVDAHPASLDHLIDPSSHW